MTDSDSSDSSDTYYDTRKRIMRRASRLKYNKRRRLPSLVESSFLVSNSSSETDYYFNSQKKKSRYVQSLESNGSNSRIQLQSNNLSDQDSPSSSNSQSHSFEVAVSASVGKSGGSQLENLLSEQDSSTDDSVNFYSSDELPETLWDDLRKTALETRMTNNQINRILADLRKHGIGPLPKDCRTLKKSSVEFKNKIKEVSGMQYFYFGLESQIRIELSHHRHQLTSLSRIEIVDNIDGLPLYKSSSVAVWPVLARIRNLSHHSVFCVLLTVGSSKPHTLDFLEEYVEEINKLTSEGLQYMGKHFDFRVIAHVCDTPARNFVKGTKSFNSYYGCDFCLSKGVHDGKRMTWPMTAQLEERTDQSFRSRAQGEHHRCKSPFESNPCDMVNEFPIDFMHQGTGVILKLIKWNVLPSEGRGNRLAFRMSSGNVKIMNSRLLELRKCVPDCFARKPRSTKDLLRYKATELRQLLLYTARIVMKGLMATYTHYSNLCKLSMACALLVDERTAKTEVIRVSAMLQSFCDEAKQLYGTSFMVYNIHCLLHLPHIAAIYGSLDSISAYCYENFLGELKRGIRSSLNPLVSAVKYVYEKQSVYMRSPEDHKVRTTFPNNCYVDISHKLCYEAVELSSKSVLVKQYRGASFISKPIPSDVIGCLEVKTNKYKYLHMDVELLLSKRRAMKIDLNLMQGLEKPNTAVFMAMLHELLFLEFIFSSIAKERREKKNPLPKWDTSGITASKNQYAVFDFFRDRPRSLLAVPETWIFDQKNCYWPLPGSPDENRVASLIRSHSVPGPTWTKLQGKLKGNFQSYAEAQAYLEHKGAIGSEDDRIDIVNTEVSQGYRPSRSSQSSQSSQLGEPENLSDREMPSTIHHKRKAIGTEISSTPEKMSKYRFNTGELELLNRKISNVSDRVVQLSTEVHEKLDSISVKLTDLYETRTVPVSSNQERLSVDDAQDYIDSLHLPISELSQLDDVEVNLQNKEIKCKLRKSLSVIIPGKNMVPLHAARTTCRLIIPDTILQYFTVRRASKDNRKRLLPVVLPNLFSIIVAQIIRKSGKDFDKAVSGLSGHIAKCSDRKASRSILMETNRDEDHDTCSVYSSTSSN